MYLCIVRVIGDPHEMEGDYISEVRRFNTLEEAKRFKEENYDYGICIDIFKGEYVC